MIKWLDELFKSFHPLFILVVIWLAFSLGWAVHALFLSPPPSPPAQDSADKEPPHMVKVTIKYTGHPVENTPGTVGNVVDTADGQRCFLHCYWGEVDDTFFVSSDQLKSYLPPPNKEQLKALHLKLIRNELEEQLKAKELEPLDIEVDVTIPLSDEDKEKKQ